jgi:hypothetical protein
MIFIKSFAIGALAMICGAFIWLVIWTTVITRFARARFHTDVAIRINNVPSQYFWILMALLFLIGFFFEFQRARRV